MDDRELCCRACRQKVGPVVGPDGVLWYGHPGNEDRHKVEPVLLSPADVINVCDFCLALRPQWAFPLLERATTRLFHPGLGVSVVAQDNDGWWGACSVCADLIRDRKIGRLRDRALAVLRERLPVTASWQETAWAKESVLLQLASFWQSSPGAPVETGVFS